jgi:hypothetical protein
MIKEGLWPEARQFQQDKAELGARVADQLKAEVRAVQQRGAVGLSILIATRIRSFNIREGVRNNDASDVPAVPVPRPRVQAGPPAYRRTAGNGSL